MQNIIHRPTASVSQSFVRRRLSSILDSPRLKSIVYTMTENTTTSNIIIMIYYYSAVTAQQEGVPLLSSCKVSKYSQEHQKSAILLKT